MVLGGERRRVGQTVKIPRDFAQAGDGRAIAPVAGLGRIVCAAPDVATALGYDIAAALEEQ
jgi:hypothetical protein